MKRRVLPAVLFVSVLAQSAWAGSLSPPGPPGSTMRSLDQLEPRVPISSCPFTITQPGSYYLTQNLQCPAGSSGITVLASNVTIDLNQFTLRGAPGSQNGIYVEPAYGNACVMNGEIRLFGSDGVSCMGAEGARIEKLRVRQCGGDGIQVSSATLSGVTCVSNGGYGIRCEGDPIPGIDVRVCSSGDNTTIIRGSALGGILMIGGSSVSIDDASFENNGGNGIEMVVDTSSSSELHVSESSCTSSVQDGLHVTVSAASVLPRVILKSFRSSSNGGDGIEFDLQAASTTQLRATATFSDGNTADGYRCSSSSPDADMDVQLDGGSFSSNGGSGGKIGTKQKAWLCSNFRFSSNGQSGFSSDPGTCPSVDFDDCVFSSNQLDGIEDGGGGGGGAGGSLWRLRDCVSSLNQRHGMSSSMRGIDKKDIRSCVFDGNSLDGFHVISSSSSSSLDIQCDSSSFSSNGASGFTRVATDPSSSLVFSSSSCDFSNNALHGIDDDCDDGDPSVSSIYRCAESSFSSNGGSGFSRRGTGKATFSDLSFTRCSMSGNALHGGDMDEDCDGFTSRVRCEDTTCADNGLSGMRYRGAGAGGRISLHTRACSMENNGQDGLVVGSEECDDSTLDLDCDDSSFSSNSGNGVNVNASITSTLDISLSVRRSNIANNFADGLHLAGSGGGGGGGRVSVHSSHCSGNGDDGIDVDTTPMTNFALLLTGGDNDCDDNDDDGIYLRGPRQSVSLDGSYSRRNGGDGLDGDCDDLEVSSSTFSHNVGRGCACVCSSSWSGSDCRVSSNGGTGIEVAASTILAQACVATENGGFGLDFTKPNGALHSSGVIHRDVAARNLLGGIRVQADFCDISECSASGHRDTTGTGVIAGIVVAGIGSHLHDNFLAENDEGIHISSGTHKTRGNMSSANTNPLYVDAAASVDSGPPSSAAAAISPATNYGF